jgi:hypothetical protein
VSHGKLAPVTSAVIVRIKKKPRGKPFQPGHGHGAATRFKPGQSGNPSGRPLCKEITKALNERMAATKSLPAKTGAEKIAKVWDELARDGNIAAIVSLSNRVEGMPATSVRIDKEGDNLNVLIAMMNEKREKLGAPEGFSPRQLAGVTNDEHE